jgi:putative ABC transport system permease protein
MITQYWLLISRNLSNRLLRTGLTILGVIIGVMIIILLFSLGAAMQNGVEEQFGKLGVKAIRVVPGGLFGPPSGSMGLTNDVKDYIERVNGIDYVQAVLNDNSVIGYNNKFFSISVISYDTSLGPRGLIDTDSKIKEGRYFSSADKESVLIGYNVANTLFKKKINVKEGVSLGNKNFRVVGIFEKTGTALDDRAYIPLETAREMFGKKDTTNVFIVQIQRGQDIEKIADEIKRELMKKYKDEDAFRVFTPEQLLKQIKSILGTIELVLIAIAAISIIVGSIGIMNSMFTSVLERTKDIGVMRAVGATKNDILFLFLIESGFIGMLGGAIGIILGVSFAYFIQYILSLTGSNLLSVQVSAGLILFSLFFSMFVGVISGLVPAFRAASLQPVEALRYE